VGEEKNFTTKLPRTTRGTGLARTGTNTGTPREPPKRPRNAKLFATQSRSSRAADRPHAAVWPLLSMPAGTTPALVGPACHGGPTDWPPTEGGVRTSGHLGAISGARRQVAERLQQHAVLSVYPNQPVHRFSYGAPPQLSPGLLLFSLLLPVPLTQRKAPDPTQAYLKFGTLR